MIKQCFTVNEQTKRINKIKFTSISEFISNFHKVEIYFYLQDKESVFEKVCELYESLQGFDEDCIYFYTLMEINSWLNIDYAHEIFEPTELDFYSDINQILDDPRIF